VIGEVEVRRALTEAQAVAERVSRCTRRQVGAVLFDSFGRFLSYGANINPPGQPCDEGHCPRGQKTLAEQPAYAPYGDCTAMHAEYVAVRLGKERLGVRTWHTARPFGDLEGGVIVVTHKPCDDCATFLAEHKVNSYWPDGKVVLW
jgi:deoxycytidylate deaminase